MFVVAITIGPKKGGHYDAHNEAYFKEVQLLATVGLKGHRFILIKLYADRPAAEGMIGLCGHNASTGCGFCTGGSVYMGSATRYLGYHPPNAKVFCEEYSTPTVPDDIRLFYQRVLFGTGCVGRREKTLVSEACGEDPSQGVSLPGSNGELRVSCNALWGAWRML